MPWRWRDRDGPSDSRAEWISAGHRPTIRRTISEIFCRSGYGEAILHCSRFPV